MTRAYRIDAPSQGIAEALEANQGPDPWGGGALSPGEFAPVVTRSQKTGQRVIRPMVWGYPAPGTDMVGNAGDMRWVPTVRNVESPFWIGNLRHSELRCLVPSTSFALRAKGQDHWFAVAGAPVFAMAGIWRDLTDMPVFAILATDTTGNARQIAASSMPVLLEPRNYERWLGGDWKDAQHLVAPFAGALSRGLEMCVVAIGLSAHPHWQLIVAGNRDEFHSRASAPLARWDDGSGIIAGRDLVSGGSWMGISDAGRLAVVTNIRNASGPDPDKLSRGALVTDWLACGTLPDDPSAYNPFNLVVVGSGAGQHLANRPEPSRAMLDMGIHGFSNAVPSEIWPRKERLVEQFKRWLEQPSHRAETLFDMLCDESGEDSGALPIFIRNSRYGTRCSTVIMVDAMGQGRIVERRFDIAGAEVGENCVSFEWPVVQA